MKHKLKIGEVAQICNATMFGAKVVVKGFSDNNAIVEVLFPFTFGGIVLKQGDRLEVYKQEVRKV